MANWIFREFRRGNKDRQPTQGEFFSTDAIKSFAEALVRETIQNSLDASLRSGEPVRVRFHLGQVSRATAMTYFGDGWKHFTAAGNGLDQVPTSNEPCRFVAVEDFNTTGLTGDVEQWRHEPGVRNPFYYFFRTEGRSGKSESERGRWGIGKYVFPRSSRINALIALTVRSDDARRLLMGQAVLKSHEVDGTYFTPDGDYGVETADDFVVPEANGGIADSFGQDFQLKRGQNSGLSVVVPWVFDEINKRAITESVVEDYFFPILQGTLIVTVSDESGETEISKDNLRQLVSEFADMEAMVPLIELAEWSRDHGPAELRTLAPAPANRPAWTPSAIPEEMMESLRQDYRDGRHIALRVPLTVREKGKPDVASYFDIFLCNDQPGSGAPVFVRDGIIISDVRARRVAGVRSLVVINDAPLGHLLGDSENPAHTQWQRDREHFKNKYTFATAYIEFVSQAVSSVVRFINESDEEQDKDLLKDIFSIPKAAEENKPREKSTPRTPNAGEVIPVDVDAKPSPGPLRVGRVASGFSVRPGGNLGDLPVTVKIEVAYDRASGNPLTKYSPADFDIGNPPITIEATGCAVIAKGLNRVVVRVEEPEFALVIQGFDENRDLYVDASLGGSSP